MMSNSHLRMYTHHYAFFSIALFHYPSRYYDGSIALEPYNDLSDDGSSRKRFYDTESLNFTVQLQHSSSLFLEGDGYSLAVSGPLFLCHLISYILILCTTLLY